MTAPEGGPRGERRTCSADVLLASIDSGGAGLVVTDPPWDLDGRGRFLACANYPRLSVDEVAATLADARRALKRGAHLYLFAPAGEELAGIFTAFLARGWVFVRALAWDKGHHRALGSYRNAFEPILIWSNGPSRGFERTMEFPSLLTGPGGTRTRKPWRLYKVFLEMSSRPGELVVDPYCGTNPLAQAAGHVAGRRWLAGDVLPSVEVAAFTSEWKASGRGRKDGHKGTPEPGSYGPHEGPSLAAFTGDEVSL